MVPEKPSTSSTTGPSSSRDDRLLTVTYDKAWDFLNRHANQGEGQLRFELDRYLGWPGQAPSYKVGERLWMQVRDELAARDGAAFDLKAFHRRALDVGSVGLDVLRGALLAP